MNGRRFSVSNLLDHVILVDTQSYGNVLELTPPNSPASSLNLHAMMTQE